MDRDEALTQGKNSFLGYVRPDGSVGLRNHVLVLPSSACSSEIGAKIASQVRGAVAIRLAPYYWCVERRVNTSTFTTL